MNKIDIKKIYLKMEISTYFKNYLHFIKYL